MRYFVLIFILISSFGLFGQDSLKSKWPTALDFIREDSLLVQRDDCWFYSTDSIAFQKDSILNATNKKIIVLNVMDSIWFVDSQFSVLFSESISQSDWKHLDTILQLNPCDSLIYPHLNFVDTSGLIDSLVDIIFSRNLLSNASLSESIPSYPISPNALDSEVEYQCADSIVFDIGSQIAKLHGFANVKYDKIDLSSAEILIDWGSSRMEAYGVLDSFQEKFGEPVFKESDQTIYAERIEYNYDTEKGNIYNLYTVQGEGYFQGQKVRKNPNNEMLLKNGRYTTCPCEKDEEPKFYLNMSKVKIIPEKVIIAGPSNLVLEGIPTPLFLPFGLFPMTKGRSTGVIIPQYGNSNGFGYYLKNGGYYMGLSDSWDLKLLADVYSKGKWLANLESRYAVKYKYNGRFALRYGVEPVGQRYTPNYGKSNDFLIKWNHSKDRKNRPTVGFNAAVEFGTNNYHQTNSIDNDEFLKNNMNSSISFSKQLPRRKMNFSATMKHRQSRGSSNVSFSAPQLNLNTSRYSVGKLFKTGSNKWYLQPIKNLSFQYNSIYRNDVVIPDTVLYKQLMKNGIISNTLSEATLLNGDDYYNMPIDWSDYSRSGFRQVIPLRTQLKVFPFNINPTYNWTNIWYNQEYRKYWDHENNTVVTDTIYKMSNFSTGSFNMQFSTVLFGKKLYKRSAKFRGWKHDLKTAITFSYRPDYSSDKYGYYDSYTSYSVDSDNNYSDSTTVQYSKYSGIFGSVPTNESFRLIYNLGNMFEIKVRDTTAKKDSARNVRIIDNFGITGNYDFLPDSLNFSDVNINLNSSLFRKKLRITYRASYDPYVSDTLNNRLSGFEWVENGRLARLKDATLSLGTRISEKGLSSKKSDWWGALTPSEIDMLEHVNLDYIDFSSPWSLSIGYNFKYSRRFLRNTQGNYIDSASITSAIDFGYSLQITPKWNITGNSSYDFRKKELGYTTLNFARQMDCWELIMSWVPFGIRRRYEFTFRVKSKLLQDIKYNRRKNHFDYQDLEE